MDRAQYRAAESEVVSAHARHLVAQAEAGLARAQLDRSVATWVEAGASKREVASRIGVSHPHVTTMVERARSLPADHDVSKRLIRILEPHQLQEHLQVFGEVAEALIAFNDGDILVESGKHPAAFAHGTRTEVPMMLLLNARGDALGVKQCNAGYGGTGPSNSVRVLTDLCWTEWEAKLVLRHRFVHLKRGQEPRAEERSITGVSGGIRMVDGNPTVLIGHQLGSRVSQAVTDWIEVFDRSPRLPWADGPRVARCYLNPEAAEVAGLRRRSSWGWGDEFMSVIVEQGETQLWCAAFVNYDWTTHMSEEAYEILDAANLYPGDLRDSEPHSWVQRLLARHRTRPSFVDVSPSGDRTLLREPGQIVAGAE